MMTKILDYKRKKYMINWLNTNWQRCVDVLKKDYKKEKSKLKCLIIKNIKI